MTQAIERTAGIPVLQQMTAFLAGMDADLDQSRRILARQEAALADKKSLCAAFPATLPMAPKVLKLTPGESKADAELKFVVTSRDEVLQLLDAFPAVPAVMLKAGCSSFIAQERFTGNQPGTTVEPIGDVVYRLATWVDGAVEEYFWWTHLDGKLVHVLAETKDGKPTCAKVTHTSSQLNAQGTLFDVTWSYSNVPHGVVTQWYGGDMKHLIPVTVHQPRGASFRDAVTKPQTVNVKVNARHCDC